MVGENRCWDVFVSECTTWGMSDHCDGDSSVCNRKLNAYFREAYGGAPTVMDGRTDSVGKVGTVVREN